MASHSNYRWPTKIQKFHITDPYLKIVATKYEKEIPWQTKVKDNETLNTYVNKVMLPQLLTKVVYPPKNLKKSLFVSARHVNLMALFNEHQEVETQDKTEIMQLSGQEGEQRATEFLVERINQRKAASFKAWIDLLAKKYRDNPGFRLLLLRSIFDLTGKGSRRELLKPTVDVIEWVCCRIEQGRLLPNENIGRLYCFKLGRGISKTPDDGWRYISAGNKNASQLAALCRGSGWCVAGQRWAENYLEHSGFHILYSNGKPVTALRQDTGSRLIVECQGRGNNSPTSWFHDIHLYLETRELSLTHRERELESAVTKSGNIDAKGITWWLERVKIWPFAVFFAPQALQKQLMVRVKETIMYYASFNDFEQLKDLIDLPTNLGIEPDYWVELIEVDPMLYQHCNEENKNNPLLKQACIQGWVEQLEGFDVTMEELEAVPDFVTANRQFLETIRDHFPAALKTKIRQHKGTRYERDNPFWLDSLLPYVANEPSELTVERMVNILLNNETGVFDDQIFPSQISLSSHFKELRSQAWLAAIEASPPLWFGLPLDLKKKREFKLESNQPSRVNLVEWCAKVTAKPWILDQKSGVPKSIRKHRKILESYRTGWEDRIKKAPWQLWFQYRLGTRRMYMSYGLLADEHMISTMAMAWKMCIVDDGYLFPAWNRASWRMKLLSAIQLSVLRAIGSISQQALLNSHIVICERIRERRSEMKQSFKTPQDEEIERRLKLLLDAED